MVLVGYGGAEERHDPITRELIDGALPSGHGVQHELERDIHHSVELFGVEGAGQLGRALDVDEEDRDLLALAAEGAPFLEDAFGQVVGRVGSRSTRSWRRVAVRYAKGGAAAVAEPGAGTDALTTCRATGLERPAAGVAEAGGGAIVVAAREAVHLGAIPPRAPRLRRSRWSSPGSRRRRSRSSPASLPWRSRPVPSHNRRRVSRESARSRAGPVKSTMCRSRSARGQAVRRGAKAVERCLVEPHLGEHPPAQCETVPAARCARSACLR